MKLLLFALLCAITVLLIRAIQGQAVPGAGSRPPKPPGGSGPGTKPPPVPPDQIVDVPFQDFEDGDGARKPPEGS